jgi:hypothetical protein
MKRRPAAKAWYLRIDESFAGGTGLFALLLAPASLWGNLLPSLAVNRMRMRGWYSLYFVLTFQRALFLGLCPHKPNGLIMRITHHYIYYGKMMKDFSHGLKTGASYCGYLRLGLAGDSIELEPRIWFRTLSCARDGSKLAPH